MASRSVIIDTDPGVDDILALLLALASRDNILAITTVHGNIDLFNTTRNILSLFTVLKSASATDPHATWAKKLFNGGEKIKLAAGAKHPLVRERQLDAAYFHGIDGLGGVSLAFPEYLPALGWQDSFPTLRSSKATTEIMEFDGVTASQKPAHLEILSILAEEPRGTVTIVAVGPLTNLSLACSLDYDTFSRVKEVVVMGGAIACPGNVTPVAEFNFLADPEAAAHLFSYTSQTPRATYSESPGSIKKKLDIKLLPLDTTTHITLSQESWDSLPKGVLKQWCDVFIDRTFNTMKSLYQDASIEKLGLTMHDPACIWFVLSPGDGWIEHKAMDIRIETDGRWTRGSCIIDRRLRTPKKIESTPTRVPEHLAKLEADLNEVGVAGDHIEEEKESDKGSWLDLQKANCVTLVSRTASNVHDEEAFLRCFGGLVFAT